MKVPDFVAGLLDVGIPPEDANGLGMLFAQFQDGRNAHLADGVRRALGREPRDFVDYARTAAATGCWALASSATPNAH